MKFEVGRVFALEVPEPFNLQTQSFRGHSFPISSFLRFSNLGTHKTKAS